MKKRLVLKQEVKNTLFIVATIILVISGTLLLINRVEEIDNGSIKVISNTEMAERN